VQTSYLNTKVHKLTFKSLTKQAMWGNHLHFTNRNDAGYLCVVTMWSVRSECVQKHSLHVSSRQWYWQTWQAQIDRYTDSKVTNTFFWFTSTYISPLTVLQLSSLTLTCLLNYSNEHLQHITNCKGSARDVYIDVRINGVWGWKPPSADKA